MGGFWGWFLTLVLVLAVFNAEKLPALRELLEEKIKNSVDAAKEGSKLASDKIKKVKTDIENKKATVAQKPEEAEENTPEEIAAELKFMGDLIKNESKSADTAVEAPSSILDQYVEDDEPVAPAKKDEADDEKPIDLEHRD